MLVETALDALQTREEAKIASGKVKFLKIPYKGTAYPTIVRETAHKKSKASPMYMYIQYTCTCLYVYACIH